MERNCRSYNTIRQSGSIWVQIHMHIHIPVGVISHFIHQFTTIRPLQYDRGTLRSWYTNTVPDINLRYHHVQTRWYIAAGRRSKTDWEIIMYPDKFEDVLCKLCIHGNLNIGMEPWHQTIGMPMGANCAWCVINIYCFVFEIAFLWRRVNEENYDMAKQLLTVEQYIIV